MDDPVRVTLSLVGVILIIVAAYYTTYYIGRKASGQSRGRLKNKNINLIDRFAISRDKSFCIVEIAGKVYVIGVTNQSMTLLDTHDAAVFHEAAAERKDTGMNRGAAGGNLKGRITTRLAAFMAQRMGRPADFTDGANPPSFRDSMNTARTKDMSGQPDREQAEHADDPEEKE